MEATCRSLWHIHIVSDCLPTLFSSTLIRPPLPPILESVLAFKVNNTFVNKVLGVVTSFAFKFSAWSIDMYCRPWILFSQFGHICVLTWFAVSGAACQCLKLLLHVTLNSTECWYCWWDLVQVLPCCSRSKWMIHDCYDHVQLWILSGHSGRIAAL